MPKVDGIAATRAILASAPETRVLVLTTFVRTVRDSDALVAPASTRRLIEQRVRPAPEPPEPAALTARERDVLRLLGRGLTNAEIAEALVIEPSTVKSHVARVLPKLGLRDRVQVVIFAYDLGIGRPGDQPSPGSPPR